MSSLEVLFEVPRWIETGLASGAFKRVGGVVVEGASKQVVAWLRDGGTVDTVKTVTDIASVVPSPLGIIMNVARGAVTLLDGHLTRQAVAGVGQQVAEVSAQVEIVRQISSYAAAISTFTAAGQVLNLALSAASLHLILQRLDRLSEEVSKLGELVRAEFNRDRDMRFKIALQAARDVFESNNPQHRAKAVRGAIDGLYEAKENFLIEFQQAIKDNPTGERLLLAQHYYIRALYAQTSRIRCYLAADDLELARQRLIEDMPIFRAAAFELIKLWMGQYPAIFFHKDVSSFELERFLQVQRWLYDDNDFTSADDARVLFRVINDLRGDFWNPAVIEDEYYDTVNRLVRRPMRTLKDRLAELPDSLTQAEVVMENIQRLSGFELELRSMRLSFDEWTHLIPEEDLQQHEIGIIVDKDMISERAM